MNTYKIEIISNQTHLKIQYSSTGKLKKLELLKGKIDADKWRSIGVVIPLLESEIADYTVKYEGKVIYTAVAVEKSLYTLFLDMWFEWFESRNNYPPKFGASDGKALKDIISYLKNITGEDQALDTWKLLLDNWQNLNQFHQKQTDLKYINSKLNVLFNELTKHSSTTHTGTTDRSVSL